MDLYMPPTPVSPNSRSVSANKSPYTAYTRPFLHHRKRISALRLSSDTTSTLPEYIPTNPVSTKVIEHTEIEDAPPGYSDSAEEADEDTDLSDHDRRRFIPAGNNSAPPTSTAFSPRSSRLRQAPSHRRKRSNPTLDPIRSHSDLYLDSLLERSVHALEMSNVLLQSSISTKTSLSGILHQGIDEEENFQLMTSSSSLPRRGSGSGMYSLEHSARGLSSRIMSSRDVQETWVEDLEQISRDVDQLFSADARKERNHRGSHVQRYGSGSGSSHGSTSSSLPAISSSPLQLYQSHRHATSAAHLPQQRASKHLHRRSSLDLQRTSLPGVDETRPSEHLGRHNDLAGVPHLRYDLQDRERFVAHPPRALTQYVVAEGNLRHGHEVANERIHHHSHFPEPHRRRPSKERDSRNDQEFDVRSDLDETIILPSTLGLRSTGTESTLRGTRRLPSRSRSRSPDNRPSAFDSQIPDTASSSRQSSRAPNAYNMLSTFVYPPHSSFSRSSRSNSTSSASRTKGKNSFPTPWPSVRGSGSVTEKTVLESDLPRSGHTIRRRHSTSPAASSISTKTSRSGGSGSSTVTSGSGSRSRSQTPKPLESGSGWRNMTPPLEVSSGSGGEASGSRGGSLEGSENSSDSCPTKQTILSLRKILDTHNPLAKPPSDDWTLISKPPRLLQQPLKAGLPAEAGTSTATASISKLFTRGVHSHEGSVTRIRIDEQHHSSFKGKGKASTNNSAAPSAPMTPTTATAVSTPSLNTKMNFGMSFPELFSSGVALALSASSPLSSRPSSRASTPTTPSHAKRISFAELPEGTQGTGPERRKRRKGKPRRPSGNGSVKGSRRSSKRQSGSDDEGDEPKGWLGWLIGISGVDGRSDKVDERLGKSWGSLNSAARGPGYGGGLDEWGM